METIQGPLLAHKSHFGHVLYSFLPYTSANLHKLIFRSKYLIQKVAKCFHSKGGWKATCGFTGELCSCQLFFSFLSLSLPEEIHTPYICLNEFCKLAVCSVPVNHAALRTKSARTSAQTRNTMFTQLLLESSSASLGSCR